MYYTTTPLFSTPPKTVFLYFCQYSATLSLHRINLRQVFADLIHNFIKLRAITLGLPQHQTDPFLCPIPVCPVNPCIHRIQDQLRIREGQLIIQLAASGMKRLSADDSFFHCNFFLLQNPCRTKGIFISIGSLVLPQDSFPRHAVFFQCCCQKFPFCLIPSIILFFFRHHPFKPPRQFTVSSRGQHKGGQPLPVKQRRPLCQLRIPASWYQDHIRLLYFLFHKHQIRI